MQPSLVSQENFHLHSVVDNSRFYEEEDDSEYVKSTRSSTKDLSQDVVRTAMAKQRSEDSCDFVLSSGQNFNFSNQTFNNSGKGSNGSLIGKKFREIDPSKFTKNRDSHARTDYYNTTTGGDLSVIKESNNLSFEVEESKPQIFRRRIARNSISSIDSISPKRSKNGRNNVISVNDLSVSSFINRTESFQDCNLDAQKDEKIYAQQIFARTGSVSSDNYELYESGEDIRQNIFRTQSGFQIDDFMSNRNSEVIHTNVFSMEKIEISENGNYAFFGGQGLNVLEMIDGDYKMIKKDREKSKCHRLTF